MSLTLFSPAKINLFLRVVGQRTDGYHELASLFQTISLGDTIQFNLAKRDSLICTDPSIPTDGSNLIMKAANLFRQKTGLNFGLKIDLYKKIPSQAGLGGGSSNAATTLWALNQMHHTNVSINDLQAWSAEIGSDIPFFFSHGTAYCTGRGEFVRDLDPLDSQKVTIVKPEIGLSTPAVFAQFRRQGFIEHFTLPQKDLDLFLSDKPRYYNDLEDAAFAELSSLSALKRNLLNSGYHTALMTGTGSAIFGLGNGDYKPLQSEFFYMANFVNRIKDHWY